MIMGNSGSGKTNLLATYFEWVWKTFGKVSLFYSSDGGAWGTKMESLVKAGIVLPWRLQSRDPDDRLHLAFETCRRASEGYWPEYFTNAEKGEVPPGVRLIAPIIIEYRLLCSKDHVVARGAFEKDIRGTFVCAPNGDKDQCGEIVAMDRTDSTVKRHVERMPGFEDVGCAGFDGLTSVCQWAMTDLQDRGAELAQTLEPKDKTADSAFRAGAAIVSGDIHVGSSTMQHYGFAQNLAHRMITKSGNIPGLVARPVWTVLVKLGTDDSSAMPIYGPEIPGNAKTAIVPQWVGNLFGARWIPTSEGKGEYRLYLRKYQLPSDKAEHLVKTRVSPGYLPEYLTDGPVGGDGLPVDGEAFKEFNLGHFYELEHAALLNEMKRMKEAYPNAPGLKERRFGKPEETTETTGQFQQTRVSAGKASVPVAKTSGRPQAGRPKAGGSGVDATPAPQALPQIDSERVRQAIERDTTKAVAASQVDLPMIVPPPGAPPTTGRPKPPRAAVTSAPPKIVGVGVLGEEKLVKEGDDPKTTKPKKSRARASAK